MISSRRTILAGASAFTIIRPALVRGAGKDRLKAGLVGCGSRGTQELTNLLEANKNVDRVAMVDMFEDRLEKLRQGPRDRGVYGIPSSSEGQSRVSIHWVPRLQEGAGQRYRHRHVVFAAGLPPRAF